MVPAWLGHLCPHKCQRIGGFQNFKLLRNVQDDWYITLLYTVTHAIKIEPNIFLANEGKASGQPGNLKLILLQLLK
jgi:hypothetical protein